jgi:hypothetical protein
VRTTEHISEKLSAFVVVCVSLLVLALGVSCASAYRGRVFGPAFGEPGSGAGQLSIVNFVSAGEDAGGSGVAVDNVTHDVYVADTGNHRVDEFSDEGTFVRAWGWGVVNGASELQECTTATSCRAGLSGKSPGEFEAPVSIAVDDSPGGGGDVYVADYHNGLGDSIVQKFTGTGTLIESWGNKGQLVESNFSNFIAAIAVAPSGVLLVGTGNGVLTFEQSSGTYISVVGEAQPNLPNGFGVDGAGNWYLQGQDKDVDRFDPAGIRLGRLFELISPDIPPNIQFVPKGIAVAPSGELFVNEGNAIQVIASSCVPVPILSDPGCTPILSFSSPQLTEGAGLAFDSQNESLYIAEAASGRIESIVLEPPAAPLVEPGSETVSDVSSISATLEAAVNPRSEPNEESTSYKFQYTTEERFQREGFTGANSIPVPDGRLAPNYEADIVTARPQDLVPDTVYHFRVTAENAIARNEGKPTEGEREGTGQEVVRTFTTQTNGVFSLPDDRAWELVSPPDKHGARIENRNGVVQASADGDSVTYLATAPTEPLPSGNSNLTQVLSTRAGGTWGSQDISTYRDFANGLGTSEYPFFSPDLSLGVVEPQGRFTASLSSEASEQTPYLRTNYAGDRLENPCVNECYRPLVTGAAGFSNVPEGTKFEEEGCEAETFSGAVCGPHFEGASPDGAHIVLESKAPLTEGAPTGSLYEWAGGQLQLVSILPGGEPASTGSAPKLGALVAKGALDERTESGAISTDGSRVVWSTGQQGAGLHLYIRDVAREETVEIGGKEAGFQMAGPDDSHVFFEVAGDLYVFEAPVGGTLAAGHTTQLTSGGGMLDRPLGISNDGASVYFVSHSILTGTPSIEGEHAQLNEPNLYLYQDGVIKLIAVLSSQDAPDWGGEGSGLMTTTRVSPDGRWLAFMSKRPLTGYDNRDITSGERDEEVFLYDASAADGDGRLVCASCNPTGARPHGLIINQSVLHVSLVDEQKVWSKAWLAASVPAWISPLYQSRYLSGSGRLFFDSADALVPSDTNGTEDVYEYEPPGVGGCMSGNSSFSPLSDGCVGLISSGTGKGESGFLDASENGDDAFFLTSAQLSASDTDSTVDVYDARVGGGVPAPQLPPACEGDACQSPVAAPNDPTPGSLTYQGPGNPVPLLTVEKANKKKVVKCSKGKRLSRGKCVKVKSKRKAKKAGTGKTVRVGAKRRTK